jgi:peptidoglycan hydrolase-like protein with peptidoglycan-binding domain
MDAQQDTLVQQLMKHVDDLDNRVTRHELEFCVQYLSYYGYLPDLSSGPPAVAASLADFQSFFGLPETGKLDPVTSRAMFTPRCGVPDIRPLRQQLGEGIPLPSPQEAKWRKTSLTYFVEAYVDGIPTSVQDGILATAFQDWMNVTAIKISRTTDVSSANLIISTGRGRRSQFDGPGNTLAWAYLPSGDDSQLLMRFDADENWATQLSGSGREILMRNVACHEFGHLLGLEHSRVNNALMAPYYASPIFQPQANDDIPRIQQLYGPAVITPPPGPVLPPTAPGTLTIKLTGSITGIEIPGYIVTKKI